MTFEQKSHILNLCASIIEGTDRLYDLNPSSLVLNAESFIEDLSEVDTQIWDAVTELEED